MSTIRIPLVGSPNNRSGNAAKDQRFINCFPEAVKNELTDAKKFFLQKRFGCSALGQPPGTTGVGRGVYTMVNGGATPSYIISVIGTKVYFTTVAGVSTQFTNVFTTSTGQIGFVEMVDNGVDILCLSDGIKIYKIPYGGTLAAANMTLVGGSWPTPHHPLITALDGYLFVQKTTGEIYQSDNENVDAGYADYIIPESFEDPSVGLARQNNLITAFGSSSIEFFYDAGNATGSVLSPNEQATIQFGCASARTIAQNEGVLVFVAQAATGGKFIVAIDGTQPHNISTPAIERLLEAEGSSINSSSGYMIRIQGHFFYVLNLDLNKRTLVYDLETKMWHEWNWYDTTLTTYTMYPMVGQGEINNTSYLLHDADGYLYVADPDLYQDAGNPIRVQVQTSKFDGDTSMLKFGSRLSFIGDFQTSSSPMTVYYSDDDYTTWKPTLGRTVDLSERAYLYRIGSFRRRAFLLLSTANTPIRLEAMELELTKGSH